MMELDIQLAVLNDNFNLNDKRVVRILIDILRDLPIDDVNRNRFLAVLDSIKTNKGGAKQELIASIINQLCSSNQTQYKEYLEDLSKRDIEFHHLFDSEYPQSLWNLDNQPLALYADGPGELSNTNIAIVGTRQATDYRIEFTENMAERLASDGYTIVSGLALGSDAAAHRGALKTNGTTIAVLPGDIETISPKSNAGLAEDIQSTGLLISEVSKFVTMHNGRYIERNRITSGISDAIIVVASRDGGGTMKQAKIAQHQKIPRFYYRPNIDDGQSPNSLNELGYVPFGGIGELFDLIEEREQRFETKSTRRKTLSEF